MLGILQSVQESKAKGLQTYSQQQASMQLAYNVSAVNNDISQLNSAVELLGVGASPSGPICVSVDDYSEDEVGSEGEHAEADCTSECRVEGTSALLRRECEEGAESSLHLAELLDYDEEED